MRTSYFARYKGANAVSIARGTPAWFKGRQYLPLSPTWDMIKNKNNEEEFSKKYIAMLDKLDAQEVYNELGEDAVLMCWEKEGDFCHRRIVSKWLEEKLNVEIDEVQKGEM